MPPTISTMKTRVFMRSAGYSPPLMVPVNANSSANVTLANAGAGQTIHMQTATATIAAPTSPASAEGMGWRVRFTPTAPK